MQHLKFILPLLPLVACVSVARAETSPEVACEQLRAALNREIALLESVTDETTADAALPELEALLRKLAAMDRSFEAEKALWGYIDNTEGVKQPMVELLQRLTIQFMRLEDAAFFGHQGLRKLLAPQIIAPKKRETGS